MNLILSLSLFLFLSKQFCSMKFWPVLELSFMPSGELLAPGDHPSHATLQKLAQPGKGAHSATSGYLWVMVGSVYDAFAYNNRRIKMYQILVLGEINLIISRTQNIVESHIHNHIISINTLAKHRAQSESHQRYQRL